MLYRTVNRTQFELIQTQIYKFQNTNADRFFLLINGLHSSYINLYLFPYNLLTVIKMDFGDCCCWKLFFV